METKEEGLDQFMIGKNLHSVTLDTNEGEITIIRQPFDFLFYDKHEHILYRAQNGTSLIYSNNDGCYIYKEDNKKRKITINGISIKHEED